MDAARSAWRSGASPVTIVYRRGRAEMPAQAEEIEAAEREGIIVRTGLAPVEVVGRDGAVVAHPLCRDATGVGRRPATRTWEPVPGTEEELAAATILVAVGEEPDPSILPEGAGIEVSGWAGDRRRPADAWRPAGPGSSPAATSYPGPKTIIDAVASGRRAAGSIHEYLAGAADGEARDPRDRPLRDPARGALTLDLAERPRAHAPLPVVQPGSFAATQVGFDEARRRAEAGRCFRCDAVYSCRDRRRRRRPRTRRPPPALCPSDRASTALAGGAP